jgi:hypothetical protein
MATSKFRKYKSMEVLVHQVAASDLQQDFEVKSEK